MSDGPPPPPAWLPSVALRLALITGTVLVLVSALQWRLVELITPLGMTALSLGVWPLMILSLLLSGFAFILTGRGDGRRVMKPLAVNLLAIGLVTFVPWTVLDLQARWLLGRSAREEVVIRALNGEYGSGRVTLSGPLRGSSVGGEVLIGATPTDPRSVLFYTYRGLDGHWSGFLYVSRDTLPTMVGADSLYQVVPRATNWYFVASK